MLAYSSVSSEGESKVVMGTLHKPGKAWGGSQYPVSLPSV